MRTVQTQGLSSPAEFCGQQMQHQSIGLNPSGWDFQPRNALMRQGSASLSWWGSAHGEMVPGAGPGHPGGLAQVTGEGWQVCSGMWCEGNSTLPLENKSPAEGVSSASWLGFPMLVVCSV